MFGSQLVLESHWFIKHSRPCSTSPLCKTFYGTLRVGCFTARETDERPGKTTERSWCVGGYSQRLLYTGGRQCLDNVEKPEYIQLSLEPRNRGWKLRDGGECFLIPLTEYVSNVSNKEANIPGFIISKAPLPNHLASRRPTHNASHYRSSPGCLRTHNSGGLVLQSVSLIQLVFVWLYFAAIKCEDLCQKSRRFHDTFQSPCQWEFMKSPNWTCAGRMGTGRWTE